MAIGMVTPRRRRGVGVGSEVSRILPRQRFRLLRVWLLDISAVGAQIYSLRMVRLRILSRKRWWEGTEVEGRCVQMIRVGYAENLF